MVLAKLGQQAVNVSPFVAPDPDPVRQGRQIVNQGVPLLSGEFGSALLVTQLRRHGGGLPRQRGLFHGDRFARRGEGL